MFETKYLIDNYESNIKKLTEEYINSDLKKMVLKKNLSLNDKYALRQARLRQKIKAKLPSFYDNFELILADDLHLEQCSSELTAKHKTQIIESGNHFTDLTAGFGIDSLFLSDKFSSSTAISYNQDLALLLEYNSAILNKKINIISGIKAEDYLKDLNQSQDLILIDPDRRQNERKLYLLDDIEPNILNLEDDFKHKSKAVLIKLSPMTDITEITRKVSGIKEIRVVSVKNECKEVLVKTSPDDNSIKIFADISAGESFISYEINQDNKDIKYTNSIFKYIYEPDVSLQKLNAWGYIISNWDLHKFAPNTHLFTSDTLYNDFPGKVLEVLQETKPNGKEIKQLTGSDKVNVITRNYPLKAHELEKKIRLKSGGVFFLVGFNNGQKPKTVIAKTIS